MYTAPGLYVGSLAKTGLPPYKILLSLVVHHTKGFDQLILLAIYREVLVLILHYLFCVAGGEYREGTGYLWAAKGKIPSNGIIALVKMSPLRFSYNVAFRGTIRS